MSVCLSVCLSSFYIHCFSTSFLWTMLSEINLIWFDLILIWFEYSVRIHDIIRCLSLSELTWQRWQSQRSIRHSQPHAARKLMLEPELLPIRVLHCGKKPFSAPVTLILTWWPTYENLIDPYFLGIYTGYLQIWTSYVKAIESYHLTDRQTRPKLYALRVFKNVRPLKCAALCGRIARIGLRSSLSSS